MTADQEALDVAMVIADVAYLHQPDMHGRCGTCVGALSFAVPWMCNTARVLMALSVVMDVLDEGERQSAERGPGGVAAVNTADLRRLISGAINFVPTEQR